MRDMAVALSYFNQAFGVASKSLLYFSQDRIKKLSYF